MGGHGKGAWALRSVERSVDGATSLVSIIGGLAVVLMMVHISLDVILKYTLHYPLVGTIEIISAYYMPAAIFLALAAVERGKHHIMVELFTQRLPRRAIAAFDAFACFVGLLYVGAIVWSNGKIAILQTSRQEVWDATFFNLPVWPARWFLPVGGALMIAYLVRHIIENVRTAAGARAEATTEASA